MSLFLSNHLGTIFVARIVAFKKIISTFREVFHSKIYIMVKNIFKVLAILFITISFNSNILAQEALKSLPSPSALVTMKYEDTYVKITYSRPHKRDRKIFGSLIPFGKVWRTGANEASEITVTKDIVIGGKRLAAGTYTLFSIPNQDKWKIIINRDLGQWGAFDYNAAHNILTFEVPVQTMTTPYEPFTISFNQKESTTDLLLMWDKHLSEHSH